ncbi:hypothetical protein, partial [Propionivibrio sp.]|uniref:hypothetical protein n=1 Tax=Propionivibrio sp. TaxID=2212460 RepID=UPI003BF0AA1E
MIETCCIPDPNVLTSLWDGLSSHLIASFWEVKKSDDKKSWVRAAEITVKAPLSESNMEMQLTWSSPFEGAGLEKGMPTVAAMLQSGSIQPYLDSVGAGSGKIADFANTFEGRTGITKMNSTQVFTGMPPVKIQVTAVFRAWRDSANEVEAPFDQLMKWALPKKLADEAAILNMAKS